EPDAGRGLCPAGGAGTHELPPLRGRTAALADGGPPLGRTPADPRRPARARAVGAAGGLGRGLPPPPGRRGAGPLPAPGAAPRPGERGAARAAAVPRPRR